MKSLGAGAHICEGCGSVYPEPQRALDCEAAPIAPEAIAPGTLVEVIGAAPSTGAGLVARSFLLGLDDPRGEPHTRLYRARFLWGQADFRAEELRSHGPTTEEAWRVAVERGDFGA